MRGGGPGIRLAIALLLTLLTLSGCVETVRCDDGEIFDDDGDCRPAPDAGAPVDGGR